MNLQGRRVLLTGASGGFGQAIARELRAQGAEVMGLDLRAGGGDVSIIEMDVADAEQVPASVGRAVAALGGLDVLINCAGINGLEDPGDAPTAVSTRKMEVNFFGTWRVTAAALPALLESRGRVINVASVGAYAILPFLPSYSASKRAISAYSDVLRARYGDRIKVITAYPSYMRTAIHEESEGQGLWPDRVYSMRLGPITLFSWEEPVEAAARGIARLCSGRAGRDTGVTWRSSFALFSAKHWPWIVELAMRMRLKSMERSGMQLRLGTTLEPGDE